jgi:hypothetical protein
MGRISSAFQQKKEGVYFFSLPIVLEKESIDRWKEYGGVIASVHWTQAAKLSMQVSPLLPHPQNCIQHALFWSSKLHKQAGIQFSTGALIAFSLSASSNIPSLYDYAARDIDLLEVPSSRTACGC